AGLSGACVASGAGEIALRIAPGRPAAVGDAFTLQPGCDKSFATCRDRFANAVNFRGFPLMPGDDAALAYPLRGEALDGGKR
ncbi:MAG: phage BR0599 family protein, partial [Parvularculaceae bacterium]|nr:phage BR0599 family protein [Parvularculaceae bacterium]